MKEFTNVRKRLIWITSILLITTLACNMPIPGASSFPASEEQLVAGPFVVIIDPQPDLQIALGETFPVFASASDENGVSKIELWVDDTLVLSQVPPDTNSTGITPLILSYNLMGTQPGVYSLVARAYNDLGILGESLAINVSVSQIRVSNEPIPVQYITADGETIKDISQNTGRTVDEIIQANPSMKYKPSAGQAIVIPGGHGNQPPPAKSAQPPSNQSNNPAFPGISPVDRGGAVDMVAGQNQHVFPNVFPAFQPPQNKLNGDLQVPAEVKGSSDGCHVTLSWQDNSVNETGFQVLRRRLPDEIAYNLIDTLPANQTSFTETVESPSKFMYAVRAIGNGQGQVNQQNVSSSSQPVIVDVQPSDNCIQDPEFMPYAHIKIVNVTASRVSDAYMSIWYSINDIPARRLPAPQGQYNPSGRWNLEEEIIPIASSYMLDGDNHIVVKFYASGTTISAKRPPEDLGYAFVALDPDQIDSYTDNLYVADNGTFRVEFKLWLKGASWAAKETSNVLPAPTNLRIQQTTPASRTLTWDWSGKASDIDGYILYRRYSCPGMDTQFLAPEMIPRSKQSTEVIFKTEPVGCIYRYEVSSYGRKGESATSNALIGDTEAAYAAVYAQFSTLRINDAPADLSAINLRIFTNQFQRFSSAYAFQSNQYNLSKWMFDGRLPYNEFGVVLGEQEFVTIGFSVSSIDNQGYVGHDSVCTGGAILPPMSAWEKELWSTTIKSADGSCEVDVNLSYVKNQVDSSGAMVKPTADIAITELAVVGGEVFAYVKNLGPEKLNDHTLLIGAYWGDYCPSGDEHIYSPWGQVRQIKIQSNLPQWVHVNDNLDAFYTDTQAGKTYDEHIQGCDLGTEVFIIDPGTEEKPPVTYYTDMNTSNDTYYMKLNQIETLR